MTADIAIAPAEIQLVLNQFDRTRLEVSSPLHGLDVATLEANQTRYRFLHLAGPDDFETPGIEAWGAEIDETPLYTDLLDSLLYAGVARYENIGAFYERRRMLQTLSKGVRFVLDTNTFYHGFPEWSGLDGDEFMIPDVVRDEITSGLNWKYRPGDIATLKRSTLRANAALLDELANQRTKRARRATHFALAQLQRITDDATQLQSNEGSTSDKEENDARIVRTARAFEQEKNRLPVMLTADQNLATLCKAKGVEAFLFVLPRENLPGSTGFGEVCRWLYALAAVWGVVKVNSVLLFSEWRGRADLRYPVKARLLNETMANGCIRDLQLCRELGSLGIER